MGGRQLCRLVFIFGVTPLFLVPKFAAADFVAPPRPSPPTPSPDTYATHAGITVANEVPKTESFVVPTISGEELNAIDTSWTVETKPWSGNGGEDVTSERAVWVMFRGKHGELDGVPQEGANYVLTHHGLSGSATTTITEAFGLPALGDTGTPSGTYTIAIAQIPESKFVVTNVISVDENGVQLVDGYDAPYTDQDFINWFAGTDTNGTQPDEMRTLEFEYIAGSADVPCAVDCFSNVLFLPGIEASRLYRPEVVGDGEDKLWEPGVNDDLSDLYADSAGTSVRSDVYVKVGGVLDETPVGKNVYKSFITEMDELEAEGIIDWTAAAYDWRLSPDQILSSGKQEGDTISYLKATSTPYIIQELRRLAGTSKSGKVTIIAHSNGGLLAKRLTQTLGNEASELIDRMILIASPQAGTPLAVAAGLHGYDQALAKGLVVSARSARTFATTSPMFYNLLPSEQYFTYVDDPIISFDEELEDWIAKYGDVVHSGESLHNFLVDSYGRVDAKTGDINQPVQLHETLLNEAEALHTELDVWTPPDGMELIQIAGWGVPTTVSGIAYKKDRSGVEPEPHFSLDGDGTVVVPSALWTSSTGGVSNYWVDLQKYNSRAANQITFGLLSTTHADILEVPKLLDFISDQVTNVNKPISDYTYLSTQSPAASNLRLQYALHSPLTLDIFDDQGNHTGVSTTTGQIEENIPGTYYVQFGDVKYIFANSGTLQHVVMSGYDTGTFTFDISEFSGDGVLASTTFVDVPVTPQTIVTFTVASGLSSASDLSVDENGDGTVDSSYASSTGELIVPVTEEPQEAAQTVVPSVGGGGMPSLLPQATSSQTVATLTPQTATSTSEIDLASVGSTTATTTFVQSPTSSQAVDASKQKTKNPVAKVQKSPQTPKQDTQVAAVAQSTEGGLWTRVKHWIMSTIYTLLKL